MCAGEQWQFTDDLSDRRGTRESNHSLACQSAYQVCIRYGRLHRQQRQKHLGETEGQDSKRFSVHQERHYQNIKNKNNNMAIEERVEDGGKSKSKPINTEFVLPLHYEQLDLMHPTAISHKNVHFMHAFFYTLIPLLFCTTCHMWASTLLWGVGGCWGWRDGLRGVTGKATTVFRLWSGAHTQLVITLGKSLRWVGEKKESGEEKHGEGFSFF